MQRWTILFIAGVVFAAGRANALDGFASGANVLIGIDAEQLSWTASAEIATDPNALGGKYVLVPKGAGNNGSASASVRLPSAGDYYVWVRVKAPRGAGHRFVVEIGGARYAWSVIVPTNWHWERVANTGRAGVTTTASVSVAKPGIYTLKVLERDDDTSLDQLVITNNRYFVPVDHCHR